LLKSCRDRFDEVAGGFFNILSAATPPVHPGIEILFGELKGEAGVVGGAVEILKPYM